MRERREGRGERRFGWRALAFVAGLVVAPLASPLSPLTAQSSPSRGDTLTLRSTVFGNTRTLWIWLPAEYHAPAAAARRYPVVYLADGPAMMRPSGVGAMEALERLVLDGAAPPVILVAIEHGGQTAESRARQDAAPARAAAIGMRDRADEYLPFPAPGAADRGRGTLFPAFLERDVIPTIAARYRVRTGAGAVTVAGASNGAVAALYAGLTRPDLVGGVIAMSLAMGNGGDSLVALAARTPDAAARIYLDMGSLETGRPATDSALVAGLRAVVRAIRTAAPGSEVQAVLAEGAAHDEAAWRARLPGALRFVLKP